MTVQVSLSLFQHTEEYIFDFSERKQFVLFNEDNLAVRCGQISFEEIEQPQINPSMSKSAVKQSPTKRTFWSSFSKVNTQSTAKIPKLVPFTAQNPAISGGGSVGELVFAFLGTWNTNLF